MLLCMKFQLITGRGKEKLVEVRFVETKTPSRLMMEKEREVLQISIPKTKKRTRWSMMMLARQIVVMANRYELQKIIVSLEEYARLMEEGDPEDLLEVFVLNASMAGYRYDKYKEKSQEKFRGLQEIVFLVPSKGRTKLDAKLAKTRIVVQSVCDARDLANTPGGHMTPELLASSIRRMITKLPVRCKILKEKEMKRLGMGGVLGVAQGSKARPRFIVLEYKGASKDTEKPIILIGKGVTYDSGGIDIKPSPYGMDMKMDMSGGAVVSATLAGLARMKVKKNIVALIPAVENMPSGESYRPGDILKSMSGKTIEVLDTDAEGRIILADALTYAQKFYKPKAIVDVATLTGASEVALGKRASAILSPDASLVEDALRCAEESGDRMWPLPLWEEYEKDIEGNFGDVANMQTKGDWRDGGTIIAGVFLWQFVKDVPRWLHIDMAPRMTPSHDEYLSKGATGEPVRFLSRFVEEYL